MKTFFKNRRPHDGWSYEEYLEHWRKKAKRPLSEADSKKERKRIHYYRYNLERSETVHDAYEPSPELREALDAISEPQLWMVLTEPWCGDSAYNLPVIAEAAQLSDKVTLRILPRDENLDIMDQYLTEGSRRVPKLVAFDEEGNELFRWGARPEGARTMRTSLLEEGLDTREMIQRLLEWYKQGGWTQVDAELAEAIRSIPAAV